MKSSFCRHEFIRLALASTVLSTLLLSGCESTGSSEGRQMGARTGAVVGLTMGALTGEAKYAAAGMAAGAVAGGAAGAWRDYEEERQDYRAETLAAAIASNNSGGAGEAPQGWNEINSFIGSWRVSLWGLDENGTRVDATAQATSSLDTTESVTFRFSDLSSAVINEPNFGSTTLRFQADRGFELINTFTTSPEGNRYVGHFDNASNKYVFFYAGADDSTYSGVKRTDYRLELTMIGGDVMIIQTWANVDGADKMIQSYRLTRQA